MLLLHRPCNGHILLGPRASNHQACEDKASTAQRLAQADRPKPRLVLFPTGHHASPLAIFSRTAFSHEPTRLFFLVRGLLPAPDHTPTLHGPYLLLFSHSCATSQLHQMSWSHLPACSNGHANSLCCSYTAPAMAMLLQQPYAQLLPTPAYVYTTYHTTPFPIYPCLFPIVPAGRHTPFPMHQDNLPHK